MKLETDDEGWETQGGGRRVGEGVERKEPISFPPAAIPAPRLAPVS